MTQNDQLAAIRQRYERLAAQAEEALRDPKQRLVLADKMFSLSREKLSDAQCRLNALQQAVRLDPFSVRYCLALAQTEHELGLLEAAIAEYRQALEHWPGSPQVNLLLGEALLSAGKTKEALKYLQEVPADGPFGERVAYDKVECALREAEDKKDWGKVLTELRKLELAVENWYEILGLSLQELEGLEEKEARKQVSKAAKIARGECKGRAQKGDKEAEERITRINVAETALKREENRTPQARVGLFCEKCLKIIIECDDNEIIQQVMDIAREKISTQYGNHEAYRLLERVAQFDPQACFGDGKPVGEEKGQLDGMLMAYVLTRKAPVAQGDAEAQIKSLMKWQALLDREGGHWPGLQESYLNQLDGWAVQAYREKSLSLASILWGEAERVLPYAPTVLHNLALVYTRLQEEDGYRWYWDQVTRVWILHSEMMPEADGYNKQLLQKHKAFLEAAQAKLQTLQNWQERLELGAIWAKEAVSFLALRQLAFRNACFRCGVMQDDYAGEEENQELLEAVYASTTQWLRLIAEWYGLGEQSALAQWWQERLAAAYRTATDSDDERYRFYDEEKEAFASYREYLLNQYLSLLFGVMIPVAEKLDIEDPKARAWYALLGRGVLSFPHRLLKPGVLKVVKGLPADTDLQALVQNYALGPWFNHAQQLLQKGNASQAAPILEEMLEVAPGFVPGMFYLAQCKAAEEKYDETYQLLESARARCKKGDELLEHIDRFAKQMDIARISKRLEQAQAMLKLEEAEGAIQECQKALRDYPGHPYVLFILAQAYVGNLDIEEAKNALRRAREASEEGSELREAIARNLRDVEEYGPQIILSKAVPKMQEKQWKEALSVLAKGHSLKPQDARVTFYEAICWANMAEIGKAKEIAQQALQQCRPNEGELKGEIENFIPQIPVMLIAKDFQSAQKAMERKRWEEALSHLDAALSQSPSIVLVRFYKALCHFQLEQWDEAERVAEDTLPLCKEGDRQAEEQLELLLKQVPLAKVGKDLQKAQKAIQGKRWREALKHLDVVLAKIPDHMVALYYQALCHFQLQNWSDARVTAWKAEQLCKEEDGEIKKQLDQIQTQAHRAEQAAKTKAIVEAINSGRYSSARSQVSQLMEDEPFNAYAHFLQAVCIFRETMDNINARRVRPSQGLFDPVESALDAAENLGRWDSDLDPQIRALRNNVEQVKEQLRSMGIHY